MQRRCDPTRAGGTGRRSYVRASITAVTAAKQARRHSGLWFLFSRHRTHRVCAYMPMSIRHHEPRSTFMFSCVQTRKNLSPIFCASPSASALHDARACIPDACERDVLTFALPSDRAEPSRCRPPPSPNRDARMAKPNANAAECCAPYIHPVVAAHRATPTRRAATRHNARHGVASLVHRQCTGTAGSRCRAPLSTAKLDRVAGMLQLGTHCAR